MTKLKNIMLLGVGAVGAVVASRLADAGYTVNVLCDAARKARYRKNGFIINKKRYDFDYTTVEEVKVAPDMVIIATKHYSLKSAIAGLNSVVNDNTIVMSLLNGIDSEATIGDVVGQDKLVPAFIYQTDATKVANATDFQSAGIIAFGEVAGKQTERVKDVSELFDAANIVYQSSDDILEAMWWKYMVNIGLNQVSAILHAPYGVFLQSTEIWDLTVAAMREVIAVGKANDINFDNDSIDRVRTMLQNLGFDGKTSMLQDVVAKRKTEVDMLAGQLLIMAEQAKLPAPVNQVLYQQLCAIEHINGNR